MPEILNIAILGSGNMANQFSTLLNDAGYNISEIYSRNKEKGKRLASLSNANYVDDVASLADSDLYFLAIVDDAIEDVSEKISSKDGIFIHFSGNKDLNFNKREHRGVFWPIFSINETTHSNWSEIPVIINGTNPHVIGILSELGSSLGCNTFILNDHQKKIVHLAAVFANNFTTHMVNASKDLLLEHDLDESLVNAIIQQTSDSMSNGDRMVQTGPAIRSDNKVLLDHLKILESNPSLQKVYRAVSKSISKRR